MSVYLDLNFSSVFCSFQHTCPMYVIFRFMCRYFIFSVTIDGTVFYILMFIASIKYRNVIGFYVFVLYPITLLNSLLTSSWYVYKFLGISYRDDHVIQKKESFVSSFLSCGPLFPFLALLHWLGLPPICLIIVRPDILASFLF